MCAITIAIPTYNRKDYLKEAIESVLSQNCPGVELLISDNHSTDGTEELINKVIKEHPGRLIRYNRFDENHGVSENWKYCIQNASGYYLLVLGDDDVLLPGSISALLSCFKKYNVVSAFGSSIEIDSNGVEYRVYKNPRGIYTREQFIKGRFINGWSDLPSSLMYRVDYAREAIKEGVFAYAGTMADVILHTYVLKYGKCYSLGIPVVKYRIHASNDTKNRKDQIVESHMNVLKNTDRLDLDDRSKCYIKRYCKDVIRTGACARVLKSHSFVPARDAVRILSMYSGSKVREWFAFFGTFFKRIVFWGGCKIAGRKSVNSNS